MKKKKIRIILDTNLWISFLITKNFPSIDKLIDNKRIDFVFCEELLLEFLEVIQRPKFEKFFTKSDTDKIIDLFEPYGIIIKTQSKVNVCRDPKDNFLLSLAKDSNAAYLLTGDKKFIIN